MMTRKLDWVVLLSVVFCVTGTLPAQEPPSEAEPAPATRPVFRPPARPATTRPARSATSRPTATPRTPNAGRPETKPVAASTAPAAESRPSILTLKPKPGDEPPAPPLVNLPSAEVLAPLKALIPQISPVMLTWIAVFVILALTIQSRPVTRWHNFDGLMLALAALGLAIRGEVAAFPTNGPTLQAWGYGILTAVAIYWVVRGVQIVYARAVPTLTPNMREGALSVFVVAGLVLAFSAILRTPLTESSRDGLAGGAFLLERYKLPYGDLPGREARSPLLYAAHAGAMKMAGLIGVHDEHAWSNRAQWLAPDAMPAFDSAAARLLNGVLFLLLFGGVALLGQRLHSAAVGQTLVVILCVFPGALECLGRAEVLLPACLLTWGLAFLTVPAVGPFLATVLMVAAGLAWPWAWLGLPILLGTYLRRGWQAAAVVFAMLASFAGIGYGFYRLVEPTLPRADGALAAAGDEQRFAIAVSSAGDLSVELNKATPMVKPDFKAMLWQTLLRAESAPIGHEFAVAPGMDASAIFFRELFVPPAARDRVQEAYREALVHLAPMPRVAACLRSVLECVWRPESVTAAVEPTPWKLWFGTGTAIEAQRVFAQRITKFLLGVMVVLLAFRQLRVEHPLRHHLFGALLATFAGAVLASADGATTNWVWLLPAALTALALRSDLETVEPLPTTARGEPPPYPGRPSSSGMYIRRSAEPRISVER